MDWPPKGNCYLDSACLPTALLVCYAHPFLPQQLEGSARAQTWEPLPNLRPLFSLIDGWWGGALFVIRAIAWGDPANCRDCLSEFPLIKV